MFIFVLHTNQKFKFEKDYSISISDSRYSDGGLQQG